MLKPLAGISWQGFRRDGYSENQLPFGLVYAAQSYDKLTTAIGVAISAQLRILDGNVIMPELKLGWGHDQRDTILVSYSLSRLRNPGRDAGLIGAKISDWRTEKFRPFASYNGEFRSNAESHQVSGGAPDVLDDLKDLMAVFLFA